MQVVVRDDSPIAGPLAYLLEEQGHDVVRAASAAEVSELVQDLPPGLLILDLDERPHEALGLVRKIRALPQAEELVLIGLTMHESTWDCFRLREGLDYLCAGPHTPMDILHVVEFSRTRHQQRLRDRQRGGGPPANTPARSVSSRPTNSVKPALPGWLQAILDDDYHWSADRAESTIKPVE